MRSTFPSLLLLTLALLAGCSAGSGGSAGTAAPTTAASPTSHPTAVPSAVSPSPSPSAEPSATASRAGPVGATDVPSRVVVEALDIDLPVVSGDATVPGNPPDYPLCNVAQYLTTYRYPGRPGTTAWVYAHARPGMFLPLLEASERDDGAELIGLPVDVYTDGSLRYRYTIERVLPHTTDRSAARDVPPDEGRLILQTSEGPRGTIPKLQVVARLQSVEPATPAEAIPAASPVGCFIP